MQVSYAYIQAFVAQLDTLNAQAGRVIVTEAKKRELERKLAESELAYEDVYDLLASVAPYYAKLASALTCNFYDGIRRGANAPGDFQAEVYDTVARNDVRQSAQRVYSDVSKGTNTVPLVQLITDEVSSFTRKASNNTVYRNAARDPAKPRYAIVPSPSACVFCQLIAANGYEYPSEQSAERYAHSFHQHCNCQATQVYGNDTISGYEPGKYAAAYDEAAQAYRSGEISEDMKQRIADAKARHDAAYKAGKTSDPWRERNAVLMVWREQSK